eukprot:scaffold13356_cov147-Amphora_coffeaeformis.AAC.2
MALANISPTRQRSSSSSSPSSSSSRTRIQASSSRRNTESVVSLQDPHPRESPAQVLRRLADVCQDEGIDRWDVYGDFHLPLAKTTTSTQENQQQGTVNGSAGDSSDKEESGRTTEEKDESFLRRFEAEIAAEIGKEDAVFMPSGVMAQSIALLIHQRRRRSDSTRLPNRFICHETSHLLLHEKDGYAELLNMKPIVVSTKNDVNSDGENTNHIGTPAMGFSHILQTLTDLKWSESMLTEKVAALMLELPHRELGGKITSWEDMVRLQDWCQGRKIALHCDGARLWEATVAYEKTPAELASLFDSVYLSFYKGLGGMSGAMVCGSTAFCDEARIWLRRFGGNLYTLLPYAASAYDGYQRNWKDTALSLQQNALHNEKEMDEIGSKDESTVADYQVPRNLSFTDHRDKLRQIVAQLSDPDGIISQLVTFDPPVPVTNMVHGYLRCTAEEGMEWCRWITSETGVQVLRRIKPLTEECPAYEAGYRSMFEWTIGNANGQVLDEVFYEGWTALAETYLANSQALENGQNPIEYNTEDNDHEEMETLEDEVYTPEKQGEEAGAYE